MKGKDTFSGCHPLVNFLYFGLVLAFSMIFMHPACLCISLACAVWYSITLNGRKAVRFSLMYMFPVFIFAAVINLAFNHEGMTILAYLPGGNPLTLESAAYGAAAAAMLVSVIVWFSCYNAVMTSDKFVYLFGRIIPSMSLVLAMTMRFVPRFKSQIRTVSDARKCTGIDTAKGGFIAKVKNGITILSVVVTWSLENAVETADSMKSRGYGLPGRTAFSIYRFGRRDRALLIWLGFCGTYIISGSCLGGLYWRYFPAIKGAASGYSFSIFLCYFALCTTPIAAKIKEDRKWNALRSGT